MNLTNYNYYNNSNVNFKSCSRKYPNEAKGTVTGDFVKTTSCLFREDTNWKVLFKRVDNEFADKDKINIYSLGCSDGSEAYSCAISIKEYIPEENQHKYTKIVASDIDEESIKAAQSGRINLSDIDLGRLYCDFVKPKNKYFTNKDFPIQINNDECSEGISFAEYSSYTPREDIKNMVEFKHADMIEHLNSIKDDGNSIVFCKNISPYLSENYRYELVETLKNKLHDGSFLVIGDFDNASNFRELLTQKEFGEPAFVEIMLNVYQRNDKLGIADYFPPAKFDTNSYIRK